MDTKRRSGAAREASQPSNVKRETKRRLPRSKKSGRKQVVTGDAKPYVLALGINPSGVNKLGQVDTADDPGHTIVALSKSSGAILQVFSYGPVELSLAAAISCSAPGRTGYHLKANDEYRLYEWRIDTHQYSRALRKMEEIESDPGTFDATHQCTTTSLEIARAADIKVPIGKGDIKVPLCGVFKGVSAPYNLNEELKKQFHSNGQFIRSVKGSHFDGHVEIKID